MLHFTVALFKEKRMVVTAFVFHKLFLYATTKLRFTDALVIKYFTDLIRPHTTSRQWKVQKAEALMKLVFALCFTSVFLVSASVCPSLSVHLSVFSFSLIIQNITDLALVAGLAEKLINANSKCYRNYTFGAHTDTDTERERDVRTLWSH